MPTLLCACWMSKWMVREWVTSFFQILTILPCQYAMTHSSCSNIIKVDPPQLKNHNIPLWLNNRLVHLICVGLVSGLKQPKEMHTFMAPLDEEFAKLAHGLHTFDCLLLIFMLIRCWRPVI